MDGNSLKEARLKKSWTQEQAALALDVTQAYLSMLETGRRPVSDRFVRRALKVLNLPPTALPLRSEEMGLPVSSQKCDFSAELSALGYPGFAYLRARKLRSCLEVLQTARLAREDTFCHDSMTQAERVWLRDHRSPAAAHCNLLIDMKGSDLPYASQ